MKYFYCILVTLFFAACNEQEAEQDVAVVELSSSKKEVLNNYLGQYFFAEKNEASGEIQLRENCWTAGVDAFELSEFAGSPGEFYFAYHGHHSIMYLLDSAWSINEFTIGFKGTLEDESSDQVFEFNMVKKDAFYTLNESGSTYKSVLILQEYKDGYSMIPCEEEQGEEISELDLAYTIFTAFFALGEQDDRFVEVSPKNGIQLLTPGMYGKPEQTRVYSKISLNNYHIFNNGIYETLLEYMQMHNNEERAFLEFVEVLPSKDSLDKEALFVTIEPSEDEETTSNITAMLTYHDAINDKHHIFAILHLELIDEDIKIITIDASQNEG